MQKHHRKLIASGVALLSVSLACMSSAWAAKPVNLRYQSTALMHSLSADSSFQQISSTVDFNKTLHVRVQETYQGYLVWQGDAVMHVPQGAQLNGKNALKSIMQGGKNKAVSMNGIVYEGLAPDLAATPAYVFSAAQADKALQTVTQTYQKKAGIKQAVTEAQTKLMVYVDDNNKAHWAFLVSFLSAPDQGLPAKPVYIVDATSFQVYKNWNNIQTLENTTLDNEEGGGFGGNEKMGKMIYDSLQGDLPELQIERDAAANLCYLENADVTVKDRRNHDAVVTFGCDAKDGDHNNIFWDADKDAVNGGFSPSNDALYAGKVIKEMYQNWYGIPVLSKNGQPMILNMRVHERMDNAYWDGSQMTFGDGNFHVLPLVSLGVGAHEISHGFTEQHSGLAYYGMSGGMNEAFSDMAAQAAEFYSGGQNSWQIGPEIFKAAGKALRYMDDPTKDGRSIANAKDFNPWLDVHYTSGVYNKFFYLLGTSKGWDTKKAFDVMMHANASYWTSGSTFIEGACGAIRAAQDHQYDTAAVVAAADGVGIDTSSCFSTNPAEPAPAEPAPEKASALKLAFLYKSDSI